MGWFISTILIKQTVRKITYNFLIHFQCLLVFIQYPFYIDTDLLKVQKLQLYQTEFFITKVLLIVKGFSSLSLETLLRSPSGKIKMFFGSISVIFRCVLGSVYNCTLPGFCTSLHRKQKLDAAHI